jgi:hypothetical protein
MRARFLLCWLQALLILVPLQGIRAQDLTARLGEVLEIGREDLLFGSVGAVCEDGDGNFYVVDQLEHKVYKFSEEGKLLLSFGQEGQGPGDFQRPSRICLTAEGRLAVADEMRRVSFLNTDGTFVDRVTLADALAPDYAGPNLFYAWRWVPEGREQILLDGEGRVLQSFHIVSRDQFSVSVPDESGRHVMFNFGRPAFSPGLLYAHNQGLTGVARSDTYRIRLLDAEGKPAAVLERREDPPPLTRRERRFFEEEFERLGRMRGWPKSVVRDIIKKIPGTKAFFDRILLAPPRVLVCRIGPDITLENAPCHVDVFSVQGAFLGAATLPAKPLHVSKRRMYFVSSDEEGNVWLSIREYSWE